MHLARLNPSGTLDPLLARLTAGESFDSAVVATTGLTLTGFERSWQRDLRRRFGGLVWLSAGGGWLIIALVVLGAARWRRRRDLPRRKALDDGWVIPPESEADDGVENPSPPAVKPLSD
jgi:hypothetical protein